MPPISEEHISLPLPRDNASQQSEQSYHLRQGSQGIFPAVPRNLNPPNLGSTQFKLLRTPETKLQLESQMSRDIQCIYVILSSLNPESRM